LAIVVSGPQPPKGSAGLTWIKLLYMVVYSAYGATSVYLTLYYRRVGLDGAQIGALIAVQPLVMLLSGPLWSLIADRLAIGARLLTLVTGLSILPMAAMAAAGAFWPIMVLTALQAFFQGPIQPLMDTTALSVLGAERHQYSVVRAFGSLGYAPVTWLTGLLIERVDIRWIFAGYAVLMGAGCLMTLRMRAEPPHLAVNVRRGVGVLVRDRNWLGFALAVFVALAVQGVLFGYVGLYLDSLGAPERVIGLSGTVGSLAQTAVMLFLLPRLLRIWGCKRLMLLALATYTLRCALWALVPIPLVVAWSQALLGLAFGSAVVASVQFADETAPPGMRTTAQALITSLISGLGRATGSMTAGPLYDSIGPQRTFGAFGILAAAATIAFGTAWRRETQPPGRRAPSG